MPGIGHGRESRFCKLCNHARGDSDEDGFFGSSCADSRADARDAERDICNEPERYRSAALMALQRVQPKWIEDELEESVRPRDPKQ